ncbi:MAG: hypothetical protein E7166_06485 [Firmicutes bacterium]|nr:hypothetical protein [Bacillota bacterium]
MQKKIGKVLKVFIPKEYKNNQLLDEINSNKIGFKVMLEDGIIEIIQEQNEQNSAIMKNDLILITRQTISGKSLIDIELYDGEIYG